MKKAAKKILSVTLCLLMLVGTVGIGGDGFAEFFCTKASALSYSDWSSVPIDSYQSFRDCVIGKAYNIDGDHGAQCWDGACILWKRIGSFLYTGTGYAKGCWQSMRDTNAGSNFDLIYNISDVKRGDVVVFDCGTTGHIGFADSNYASNGYISVLGQNQSNTTRVTSYDSCGQCSEAAFSVNSYSSGYFLGAFRYKNWTTHTCDYNASISISKAPTKTTTGTRVYTCSCGKTKTETIPAIPYTTDLAEGIYVISSKCDSTMQIATNNQQWNVFVWNVDDADQYWLFRKNSDGTYTIESAKYDSKVFDISGVSMKNYGNLCTYTYCGVENEKFYVIPDGNYYKLVAKHSYMTIDLAVATVNSVENGTNIHQWSDHGGANQRWTIKKANPTLTYSASTVNVATGCSKNVTYTFSRTTAGTTIDFSYDSSICDVNWNESSKTIIITGNKIGNSVVKATFKDKDTGIVYNTKEITVNVLDPANASGHDFSAKNTDKKYLASEATCKTPATYYYSCATCGKASTTTFTYGKTVAHNYIETKVPATCTEDAYLSLKCSVCGSTTTKKITGEITYSDWSETKPANSADYVIESKTQYRYRKQTQAEGEWVKSGSGTHYYFTRPTGFNSSAFTNFATDKMSGYTNDSTKRIVSDPVHNSYIYWHWCCPNGTNYGNWYISDTQGEALYYNNGTFWGYASEWTAFESSTKATDYYSDNVAAWTDKCEHSKWFFEVETFKQTYVDYKKATSTEWSDWSSWQDSVVTSSDKIEVETRTVYRTKTSPDNILALGHSFVNYIYNNDATPEKDGTETATCTRCGEKDTRIKSGTKITLSNATISVPNGKKIGWRYRAKMTATSLLPNGYHIAWFEGDNKVSDDATYTTGSLKEEHTYTAKIVDSSGNVVSKESQEKSVTVSVKTGFFDKLVSFFKRLFGSDVTTL